MVEMAHRNPKFVEDVVRAVLVRLLKRYPKMPDTAWVRVKSEAEESIHKHNAFAERSTTFGELRALQSGPPERVGPNRARQHVYGEGGAARDPFLAPGPARKHAYARPSIAP